jgi:exodeoxyribonuclease-3
MLGVHRSVISYGHYHKTKYRQRPRSRLLATSRNQLRRQKARWERRRSHSRGEEIPRPEDQPDRRDEARSLGPLNRVGERYVKLVAFNIRHGGGSRVGRIQEVIAGHDPDFLILPEYRNNPSGASLRKWLIGFGHIHQAAGITNLPAHNSVLVSARRPFARLPFPDLGTETRRCVAVKLGALTIFAVYFAVMEAKRPLFQFLQRLPKTFLRRDTLLMGDFNTGCRYWDEGRMDLSLVEEFGAVLGCGWTDVWRTRNPGVREWSWVEPWGKHVGYRLDHALISPTLLPKVTGVHYSHAEREAGVSDHSALILELA